MVVTRALPADIAMKVAVAIVPDVPTERASTAPLEEIGLVHEEIAGPASSMKRWPPTCRKMLRPLSDCVMVIDRGEGVLVSWNFVAWIPAMELNCAII